jgi:hypothetical protein
MVSGSAKSFDQGKVFGSGLSASYVKTKVSASFPCIKTILVNCYAGQRLGLASHTSLV